MLRSVFAFVLLTILVLGCAAPAAPAPTAVPVPTTAPEPTVAPSPTAIPVPTVVPSPTALPEPTVAPSPTSAPEPTTVPDATAPAAHAADPFGLRVGQYYMDSAGFHDMATVLSDTQKIDLEFRTRVARVSKILKQVPFPADLETEGHEFNQALESFSLALRDSNVPDAVTTSDTVHDAQHDLSHAIDEWFQANPTKSDTVDPFNVALVQYYLDTTGFHDMATVLSDTQKIDTAYLSKVSRLTKVLEQAAWPSDLATQAESSNTALASFATALRDQNVAAAVETSDTVHDAQHDLSHEISAWLETNPPKAQTANSLQISIAQYYLDSAGFHDMAEALAKNEKIEASYLTTVARVAPLLKQTNWTPELEEQAQAFIKVLDDLTAALRDDKVQEAITLSDTVHDAQHDLSHAIDEWLGGAEAGH